MQENKFEESLAAGLQRALIAEQTALIHHLLEFDPGNVIRDDIELVNYSRYKVELSYGVFFDSNEKLIERKVKVEDDLEALQNEYNRCKADVPHLQINVGELVKQISIAESDLERLENPEYVPREVLEWWLVSFWLSKKLEEQGQPIIRALGCCWWGRCSLTSIHEDPTIQSIMSNLELL